MNSRLLLSLLLCTCAVFGAESSAGTFATKSPRYLLQPNDVIEVQYRYTPEYNQMATVQPDGFVSLLLIGDIPAVGQTLAELRGAIGERAAQRLKNPVISVLLKQFEKPCVTVQGEVASPGRFELHSDSTVLQAIAMAGGLKSATARHSQVILFRRVDATTAETKILNLKKLMASGNFQEDVALRSGDALLVPQNAISKIERFVKWGSFGVFANPFSR